MIATILIFEGYDGSGKTTLIKNLELFLIQKGKKCILIGRDYDKGIKNITNIIQDKESPIGPITEILLRLARENQRVETLKQVADQYDYILLDRGIISAVSWIYYYSQVIDKFRNIIKDIVSSIGNCYIIYCYLPFEETWKRINNRVDQALSKKEQKGKDENKKMFDALHQTFIDFNYKTIERVEIKTDKSREDCLVELLSLLQKFD